VQQDHPTPQCLLPVETHSHKAAHPPTPFYGQVGSFELKVKRSIGGAAAAAVAAAAAPPTVVIKEAPAPTPLETVKSMDESVDESLIYVSSPKVSMSECSVCLCPAQCAYVLARIPCPSTTLSVRKFMEEQGNRREHGGKGTGRCQACMAMNMCSNVICLHW